MASRDPPVPLWIGSVVLECKEFVRMTAFWKAALGYVARTGATEDWVVLEDPSDRGPNLSLQKVGDGPGPEYRFHLDLYTSEPEAEVARLLALGATMREPAQSDRDFVTLDDPDGNPFDVIDKHGFAKGQRRA